MLSPKKCFLKSPYIYIINTWAGPKALIYIHLAIHMAQHSLSRWIIDIYYSYPGTYYITAFYS